MVGLQDDFLRAFRDAFAHEFRYDPEWVSGQTVGNKGLLLGDLSLRRNGVIRRNEGLELGDLRANLGGKTLIIEFDSGGASAMNLIKFWPYLRGEMDVQPISSVTLCYFSDWYSYGSYRDMWKYLLHRMQDDPKLLVEFIAKQFDSNRDNSTGRIAEISRALVWIAGEFPSLHG